MTIQQYQNIVLLDSGSTTYEADICKILNINMNRNIKDVKVDIEKQMKLLTTEFKKKLKVNGKWYMAEEDILECSYEQFVELDRILAEEDNINNLHRLLAIYFRPRKFNFRRMKWQPTPFDMKNQEQIAKELQSYIGIAEANGLVVFFYQTASKSLKYINISFLNQQK